MRYFVPFCLLFLFILTLTSCKQNKDVPKVDSTIFTDQDSLSLQEYELNNIVYSVPSPHQISMLIYDDYPHYEESIFNWKFDINNYSTSEKKALILGALCADLGYLSLYDQKELSIKYLNHIRNLIDVPKLSQFNPNDLFKRIDKNLGNSDSIITIISEIIKVENEAIRNGERPYLSSLIIAGGWIESFYILNTLYSNSKNSYLFGILLQQQYVLDNLIQILRPYYKKSREYTELVDQLVEIAYEFEVVDVIYKNMPPENSGNTTNVKCRFTHVLTGSQLERMNQFSKSLRKSLIY